MILPAFIFLGLLYKLKKRKKMEVTADEKQRAFQTIAAMYGTENARKLERMVRWETAHFTSNAFKKTFAAGMEATKTTFPYGWTSLASYWKLQPDSAPLNEFVVMTDSGGRKVKFLKFKSFLGALKTMAKFLSNNNWNAGEWYSNDPEAQKMYASKIDTVKNKFV